MATVIRRGSIDPITGRAVVEEVELTPAEEQELQDRKVRVQAKRNAEQAREDRWRDTLTPVPGVTPVSRQEFEDLKRLLVEQIGITVP